MEKEIIGKLIEKSLEAKNNSYSVYSHYPVGAALLTTEGEIITGCNIENIAFTPTVCAKRTAFFKAISDGFRNFTAIAITAGNNDLYPSPCGVCRQVMREFCDPKKFIVIRAKSIDDYIICKLEDLLPEGFGPEYVNTINA